MQETNQCINSKLNILFAFAILTSASVAGNNHNKSPDKKLPAQQWMQSQGLQFLENKGQMTDMNGKPCPEVLFKAGGGNGDIYIRNNGISYVQSNISEIMHQINEEVEKTEKGRSPSRFESELLKQRLIQQSDLLVHRLDLDFEGANPEFKIQTSEELEGSNNYFYAHCPKGILGVKSCNVVTQKNIYPGIDVKYYASTSLSTGGLKYDIVVNPGADPNQIKIKYNGAEELSIENERLKVKTSLGVINEQLPKVYQNINGKIVDVKAEYKLEVCHDKSDRREEHINIGQSQVYFISFRFSDYNPSYPLIIDPFIWATFYGGLYEDNSGGINTDNAGNVIVSGHTYSLNFPVSAGATQLTLKGGNYFFPDVFVIKFNSNGGRLWATYYGGTDSEYAYGIDADSGGNIIVTGVAWSSNFPVLAIVGGFNQLLHSGAAGTADAFVVKFSPGGIPVWSTYYGGSSFDRGIGLTVDGADNIVITGETYSGNFPVGKIGANISFQGVFGGNSDLFVVKFNGNEVRQWATFYGGTLNENCGGITSDAAGNITITGDTRSVNFPTGAVGPNISTQPALAGFIDIIIVKFDPTGARLWSTFYGGIGLDSGHAIASDSFGNIIVTGYTNNTFPVTANAFQGVLPAVGAGSTFVIKLSATGSLLWSTYHGGTTDCWAFACCVDAHNYIYIFGDFEDNGDGNFPMNTCGLQKTYGGGSEDCFITKFSPNGKRVCSTFIGGNGEDELDYVIGGAIASYGNYIYITLCDGYGPQNNFGNFPVTAGAFQTVYGGGVADAIVAKFCGNSCGDTNGLNSTINVLSEVCTNSAVQMDATITRSLTCDTNFYIYSWTFAGGVPASSTQQTPPGIMYSNPGNYTVTFVVNTACDKDSISKTITIADCNACTLSSAASLSSTVSCKGDANGSASVTISNGAGGPYNYVWSNGITGATNGNAFTISGLSASTYTVTVSEGTCTTTTTIIISEPPLLSAEFTKGTAKCSTCGCREWIFVSGKGGTNPYTYSWPGGYNRRYLNHLCPGNYAINIKDKNGCSVNVNLTAP